MNCVSRINGAVQIIKTFLVGFIFIVPMESNAQSTLLPQGAKENILLDRLEIKLRDDSVLNFSSIKPFNRKWWAAGLAHATDTTHHLSLSKVDRYNISRSLLNNQEWTSPPGSHPASKKPILNSFYKDPANMIAVHRSDFFLAVNPVLQFQLINDNLSDELAYLNTRGVSFRSLVAKKIGFQGFITTSQERPPVFVRNQVNRFRAVPGAGLYKKNIPQTIYDYFDGRGSVFFNAAKFIDVQFGYDRMFLGNGYRSLFFSDFSHNHLFLNLNLRVWKFNYMSRIMELQPQYTRRSLGQDTLFSKKYAAVHYLTINVPKWLTLGLFEGVVFGRPNRFEFHYLNPVMFLRNAELQVGSPDNAFIGFDAKANIARSIQLYGQVMIDELFIKFVREKKGWWGNKWAFQGGLKYIDVAGISNLDLQLEGNWIRPFTYSHFDTVANYTHFNQPLAHPLMSGVREAIGILRYQPAPKWYMQAKAILWNQGIDPAGQNYGNNIFMDSDMRSLDEGLYIGAPAATNNSNLSLWLAYELRENMFLETTVTRRKVEGIPANTLASFGLRWNMHRREYDY